MSIQQTEVPYGTLDLLILKTLETMGPLHGYAIARRIEQVSWQSLQLSQGSVYPALIRLEQDGWISTEWGLSETKVKFYSLTKTVRNNCGSRSRTGRRRRPWSRAFWNRHDYSRCF